MWGSLITYGYLWSVWLCWQTSDRQEFIVGSRRRTWLLWITRKMKDHWNTNRTFFGHAKDVSRGSESWPILRLRGQTTTDPNDGQWATTSQRAIGKFIQLSTGKALTAPVLAQQAQQAQQGAGVSLGKEDKKLLYAHCHILIDISYSSIIISCYVTYIHRSQWLWQWFSLVTTFLYFSDYTCTE